jgi:hypothetical protein
MSVWQRLSRRQSEPEFSGAPPVRRIKSYPAQSGYVYQYYFDGLRDYDACKEYRFQAAIDAESFAPIVVRVPNQIVRAWQTSAGRELVATELYGVAKLLLFRHMDKIGPEALPGSSMKLTHEELDRISKELDF